MFSKQIQWWLENIHMRWARQNRRALPKKTKQKQKHLKKYILQVSWASSWNELSGMVLSQLSQLEQFTEHHLIHLMSLYHRIRWVY